MKRFSRGEYDGIYKKLADGKITVKKDQIKDMKDLETGRVKIELVK